MLKNRSFLKGMGTGVIVGAMLLQLMLLVQDTKDRVNLPDNTADKPAQAELTAELVREKAASLNLQVFDKGIKLYNQAQLEETVNKAVEAAKAEAAAALPAPGPKQVTVYITPGMTAVQVVDYLYQSGVIVDRLAFQTAISQQQATASIRSGLYTFNLNESIPDVIAKLTTVPPLP